MRTAKTYSTQKLLFFVAQDFEPTLIPAVAEFVRHLGGSREWSIHPPSFVNEGTGSVRTLGGFLSLYDARPPVTLPVGLDRKNLEDVKALVQQLKTFSGLHKLAFELELDGDHVGSVEDGDIDNSLRIGLLAEWERILSERGG